MRRIFHTLICVGILVLGRSAFGVPKPHVISFGKWTAAKWYAGPQAKAIDVRIRALYVDTRLKEYTTGPSHDVTDRLFVVRRMFRLNDTLPSETTAAPKWTWERGGWLLVDRVTGRVTQVSRVKALLISSLDSTLPKVTLEFFLKYEGVGAPIKWEVNDCREKKGNVADHGRDSMCVEADIVLKDGFAAVVLISVGTSKRGLVGVPVVYGVRVTDPHGTIHRLDRLSDLPVELHRPLPKGPNDLPAGLSARLLSIGR